MRENTINNRIAMALITTLFLACAMVALCTESVFASPVIIGQATGCENGGTTGGRAGDQSGGEVGMSSWGYSSNSGNPYSWKYVFRAKDPAIGKQIAENMKAACNNNCVGYDLNERTTFFYAAKAANWDIASITTNCETSCVDCVSVCLNAAGIHTPAAWASVSVYSDIMATGQFDCYTSAEYVASSANLLPGDILCNPNGPHTAMVVESHNSFYFDVSYTDTEGADQVTTVEDGSEIKLNLNNGYEPKAVTIETTTDLKDFEPKRKGASFSGWEMNAENQFSAKFQASMMSIDTGNLIKPIE